MNKSILYNVSERKIISLYFKSDFYKHHGNLFCYSLNLIKNSISNLSIKLDYDPYIFHFSRRNSFFKIRDGRTKTCKNINLISQSIHSYIRNTLIRF